MEIGVALERMAAGVEALAAVDARELQAKTLVAMVREVEVLRRRLDAATTGLADAVDRTAAYRIDGHASATSCLKHLGRLAGGEAAGRVKGAAALRRLPLVTKSFGEGRIPSGHIAALGRVGANPRVAGFFEEADEWFRERACELDHDGFVVVLRQWEMLADADGAEKQSDREHRNRNATVTKGFDGSFRTKANHAAVQGATIEQILEAFERAEFESDWADARSRLGDDVATKNDLLRTSAQRRADAMYKIFQLAAANPDVATGGPTVNIVIDEQTFATELERRSATGIDNVPDHDPTRADRAVCRTVDGVPLTPAEVVQTAMSGLVRAIIIDAKGNVINHGRARRLFAGASRDAVLLREAIRDPAGVRCGFGGCGVSGRRCQIDHREPAARGGPTDHDNGDPLCGYHNRLKETGFHPRQAADGTWTIHRPDGTPITAPA
ncbi:MAG TPA: DUF222 domain-containing protein [Acidimicrobiales bacterium]|nr:DUF222 domain-containing protein [Acidimicrobiales bacterium]